MGLSVVLPTAKLFWELADAKIKIYIRSTTGF